jgi:hypothetical protein
MQKISQNSGKFSGGKNMLFSVHVYHAFHHVLTSKSPRSAHHFSQNTLQKQQESQSFSSLRQPNFF